MPQQSRRRRLLPQHVAAGNYNMDSLSRQNEICPETGFICACTEQGVCCTHNTHVSQFSGKSNLTTTETMRYERPRTVLSVQFVVAATWNSPFRHDLIRPDQTDTATFGWAYCKAVRLSWKKDIGLGKHVMAPDGLLGRDVQPIIRSKRGCSVVVDSSNGSSFDTTDWGKHYQ